VAGSRGLSDSSNASAAAIRKSFGVFTSNGDLASIVGDFTVRQTIWPWAAIAGGAVVAAAGLLTLVRGWSWPGPAARFERDADAATNRRSAGSPSLIGPPIDPLTTGPTGMPDYGTAGAWDALSRGEDPTSPGVDQT
jgi:uncharacterized membrane protein (TIGR02234 family)